MEEIGPPERPMTGAEYPQEWRDRVTEAIAVRRPGLTSDERAVNVLEALAEIGALPARPAVEPLANVLAAAHRPAGASWHAMDTSGAGGAVDAAVVVAYEAGQARVVEEVRAAKRRLYARLIASAHLLEKPFTDEPSLSPWVLLSRDMAALDWALGRSAAIRTREDASERVDQRTTEDRP